MDPARPDSSGGAGRELRTQDVARRLREAIHEGTLKPGEPIRQESVALEFGVSRLPVREALRQLEAEGLVVHKPHSGARVAALDYADCEEIYKMRERLEPLALAESIGRLDEEQLERTRELAERLKSLQGDPQRWLDGDRELHLACYAGVATPRLLQTIIGFWNTTQQYRRVLLTTFEERDYHLQHEEHDLILDALASGNGRASEDLVRVHIERSRLRLARNRHLFER